MDFLLDVNASGAVARWLIDRGHNVAEVGQTDPRMSDDKILSWAVREHRIIVTTDNDFEEMIWRQGKLHCGVLRLENLPRSERITLRACPVAPEDGTGALRAFAVQYFLCLSIINFTPLNSCNDECSGFNWGVNSQFSIQCVPYYYAHFKFLRRIGNVHSFGNET